MEIKNHKFNISLQRTNLMSDPKSSGLNFIFWMPCSWIRVVRIVQKSTSKEGSVVQKFNKIVVVLTQNISGPIRNFVHFFVRRWLGDWQLLMTVIMSPILDSCLYRSCPICKFVQSHHQLIFQLLSGTLFTGLHCLRTAQPWVGDYLVVNGNPMMMSWTLAVAVSEGSGFWL